MNEPTERIDKGLVDGEGADPTDPTDPTAPYHVSGTPTGGPGPWPTQPPKGEALVVFEEMVRQTGEPPERLASRVLLTVVVVLTVALGSLAYRQLDDRADEAEGRVDTLEQQVSDLEQRVAELETEAGAPAGP